MRAALFTVLLSFSVSLVGAIEIPADDRYAAAVWHCETISGNVTADDTATGRTARNLKLDYGGTITLSSSGVAGNALNFGTDGTKQARGTSVWPGAAGDEFRLDGWFYFNANGLPGVTGAATMYVFYISNSKAGGVIVELFVHTNNHLRFGIYDSGGTKRIASLALLDSAAGVNLTNKWVRVIATSSNAPGEQGARLVIMDGETRYENFAAGSNGNMRMASRTMYVGHMDGKTSESPRRGFRGMIDELKLSIRADEPNFAYGPSPAYNATVPAGSAQTLSWRAGTGATGHTVRCGTSATMGDNPVIATGVTGGSVTTETLSGRTYYWQVDTETAGGTVAGDVWKFATESGGAYGPSPANNATDVTYPVKTLNLGWSGSEGTTGFEVYFGTSAETMISLGSTTATTITSPELAPYTRYYWRVDSVTGSGTETGPVWTFRTRVKAFPGADGFGRWARGGRGGSVYHVTNLNDSGAGSFRDAVSGSNRYVVFDVAGVIHIDARVILSKNLTIAGQTAPGGGVVIYGNGVSYSNANDTITRHMRYRMGAGGDSGVDNIAVANGTNIIWDHCSASWGRDETFSISSSGPGVNEGNFTIQNSVIGLGLLTHSAGSLIEWNNTSILRTLYIDNHTRNPKVKGVNEFINNVVYNWRVGAYILGDTDGDSYANIVNNYFVNGPGTGSAAFTRANANFRLYAAENYQDSDKDGVLNGQVIPAGSYGPVTWQAAPFAYPGADEVMTASKAFKVVASRAGAWCPARDHTDARLMTEVRSLGTLGQIITSENDAPFYGVGTVADGTCAADSDGDGMCDYWEAAMGHNPGVQDHNGDADDNGYTNLEDYLNWLAMPHLRTGSGQSCTIDLRTITEGFGAGRTFLAGYAVNGTVTLLADGYTAQFTAAPGFRGLAEFKYYVADSVDSWIETIGVLVMDSEGLSVTPDPMTWATPPQSAGPIGVTMAATPGVSAGPVEYYFTCVSGGGHDSGWQGSSTYTDWKLKPATTYAYTVKARSRTNPDFVTADSAEGQAVTDAMPATAEPVAHWRLDETGGTAVADVYGNCSGTLDGADETARGEGRFGNGLFFNGAEARVYVPHQAIIDFADGSVTVVFWLKDAPERPEGQHIYFVKGTYGAPDSGKRYEFYRKKTASGDEFRFCADDNVTKSEVSVPAAGLATGAWVCVAGVRDRAAGQLQLYADGRLMGTTADNTGSISQDEPLYIGDASWANAMDEVRVYDYALSAAQIQGIVSGLDVPDVYAPRPDPTGWQAVPTATGISEITMTAMTASDDSGVEYYFANLTDPAHDSGWVQSASWTDTQLTAESVYTYRAAARDLSAGQNMTGWSPEAQAMTPRYVCESFPAADFNLDCKVDLAELAALASQWGMSLQTAADLNGDGSVDVLDLAALAEEWLACGRVPEETCLD